MNTVMALQIKKENGVFILEGAINNMTARPFKKHMDAIMLNSNEVTIDIEKVKEIDQTGLSVLKKLYLNYSMTPNRTFYIVGYGCKEIYDDFRYHKITG